MVIHCEREWGGKLGRDFLLEKTAWLYTKNEKMDELRGRRMNGWMD